MKNNLIEYQEKHLKILNILMNMVMNTGMLEI